MKRFISTTLAVAFALLLFGSCGKTSANGDKDADSLTPDSGAGEGTLTVLYLPGALERYDSAARIASHYFSQLYDIKVEYYPEVTWDDIATGKAQTYFEKLSADIMTGNGPDVFVINSDWNSYIGDLYKKMDAGAFLDLNEVIKGDAEFDIGEYEQRVLDAGLYKGKRYFLPFSYRVPAYITAKERLENLGMAPEDFYGYERFITACEIVQEKERLLFASTGLTFYKNASACGWFDECIDFETGAVDLELSTTERIVKLAAGEHLLSDEILNGIITMHNSYNLFLTEEYSLANFAESPVDFASFLNEAGANGDDIVMLPVPNATGYHTAYVADYCMISGATDNPGTAWKYVKCFLSDRIQESSFQVTTIGLRAMGVKSVYRDEVIDAWFTKGRGISPATETSIDRVKEYFDRYDNVVFPFSRGYMVYTKLWTGLFSPEKYAKQKAELANYLKIYLSE